MRCIAVAAVGLGFLASAGATLADCSSEVLDAVRKQTLTEMFRKETNMITINGPAKMTIEVIAPDRMRQVVTLLADPKPVESILIGGKAWSKAEGEGWKKLEAKATGELFTFFQGLVGEMHANVGKFRCLGIEPVKGRQLRAYLGVEDKSKKPPVGESTAPKNEAERVIYVDPKTGLLARTIYARKGKRDKPIFAEDYFYPTDIKIDEPKVEDVKAAE